MAIKTWQNEERTYYEIRAFARSKNDRRIRVDKSKTGFLTEKDPIKIKQCLDLIFRNLENEAHREVALKEHSGILWRDLVTQWENDISKNGSATGSKSSTLRGHIQRVRDFTPNWDKRPCSEITPADVKSLLDGLKSLGYSDSSRYNVKVAIGQCFNWGLLRKLVRGMTVSPTASISVSRKESKRPEILNYEQICFLVSEAKRRNHPWQQIWRFSLLTGTRSGEAFEIRCGDVDKTEKRLFLERKYNFENRQIEGLKDQEWRQVPVNEELNSLFEELDVYNRDKSDYILPRITAWKNGEAARILRAFCDEIGIPSICFHTLRACWATQLLRGGVKPVVVMALGGWSDLEVMQRYIRVAGLDTEGATDCLSFDKNERPARVLSIVK